MLQQNGLIMSDAMIISIIIKVHHNKRLATTDFARRLRHCGLVEGRCIRVYCIDHIPSRQSVYASQDNDLRFRKVIN